MKGFLAVCGGLIATLVASFSFADTLQTKFEYVQFSRYKLTSDLPPKILLTFEFPCNRQFVRVLRFEEHDPMTQKTAIVLGGMVRENLLSSCAGIQTKHVVEAGNAFSGREYYITKLMIP